MILIPGLESSGEVWNSVVDHFQSHYQIHVLTLAGFAGQPAIPGLHLVDVKDDIINYIRDEHLDQPVIADHSLGGFLALWVASSAPNVPSRVISVDGVPFLPGLMDPGVTVESAKAGAEKIRIMYASMKPGQMAGPSKMSLGYIISYPDKINVATDGQRDPIPLSLRRPCTI
jgi:N-formylmaleamate deformylase